MSLVLGIDIGTTSVKAVVIDETLKHECFSSKNTDAQIDHPTYKEQDTNKIMKCIHQCLQTLKDAVGLSWMSRVSIIAPCGQMHGCVFWNSQTISMHVDLSKSLGSDEVSNLITWQDPRCDKEFLASLPLSRNFPAPLSSGFGCATILWLKTHNPDFLSKYDSCGTIADYLVVRLCALIKPVMSNQNCASWGFFNPQTQNWDLRTMIKANFPVEILPVVACPGTSAGKLCSTYMGITHEAGVVTAMGDMQCSVLSCQIRANEAVLNISTSAQLSMLVEREHKSFQIPLDDDASMKLPHPVTRVPYFGGRDLLTSASLNGGAVFDDFIQMVGEWTRLFDPDVTDDKIYEKMIASAQSVPSSAHSVNCTATLYGERHKPDVRAAFANIGVSDLHLPVIARSVVRGILQNVRSMFESGGQHVKNITNLRACGGAFRQNALFKELLPEVFHDTKITFSKDADAAFGAAFSIFAS